jgi:hypothetical protein
VAPRSVPLASTGFAQRVRFTQVHATACGIALVPVHLQGGSKSWVQPGGQQLVQPSEHVSVSEVAPVVQLAAEVGWFRLSYEHLAKWAG